MRALFAVVGLFLFVAWDLGTAHGVWTRTGVAMITRGLHQVGLL